jgi:putative ABC transport system permease protein
MLADRRKKKSGSTMIKDYFKIAFGSLRKRRLRSWLTMLGIIIGITAVVSLVGMGQGLSVAIISQFGDLGTDKLTVTATGGQGPPGTAVIHPLTNGNLEKIQKAPGVLIATGRLIRSTRYEFDNKLNFGYMASMPDGEQRKLVEKVNGIKVAQGRLLKDGDTKKIVIGSKLAEKDGNGKQIVVGSKIIMQDQTYEVIGILEKIGSFIIDGAIFINEDDMRELLSIPKDDYDIIAVQVRSTDDIEKVQQSIQKIMRKERDVKQGEEDFTVQTPQALLGQVNSTLFAVKLFVYIIASISIIVGGIGIMNTMFTSVLERTREIGIMKSIGAKNSAIFSLFFIESGLLGAVGGIIGALFGILLAVSLSAIGRVALGVDLIRADISIWLVSGAILGAFVLGSIFGIIPALNAAKLHPVEALNKRK